VTLLGLVFDALLALSLPLLAWRVLATRDLFKAVILFIAFGLLVATYATGRALPAKYLVPGTLLLVGLVLAGRDLGTVLIFLGMLAFVIIATMFGRHMQGANGADPLTHVVVSFHPRDAGSRVYLVHSGWRSGPEWEEAHRWQEAAWSGALARLEELE
jgi:hypothetical protein